VRNVGLAVPTGWSKVSELQTNGDSRPRFDAIEMVGLCLAGALIAWTIVAALVGGGDPLPLALLVLGSGAVFVVSRRAAIVWPAAVPMLLVGLGLLFIVVDLSEIFSAHPASGPFGYANAKAALYVLAAIAAVMVGVGRASRTVRIGALIAAIAFALVPVASHARAATAVAASLPLAAIVAIRGGPRRAFISLCAIVVLVAALGTAALGAWGDPASLGETLDRRRVRLWTEAASLMREHPLFGVGPGRFAAESPTGGSDEDARWAHQGFLHQGAETGVPGYVLLLLLFLWALLRIATAPGPPGTAVLAAAGVTALATMASFDYVLHFPLITLFGAAMAGAGAPQPGRSDWRPGAAARTAVKFAALPWGLLSGRRAGDLVILLYHRVGAGGREIDIPADRFEEQMAMLAGSGDVRSLDDALRDGAGGVVVTFDDGFRDFHEGALPALVRHRIPAVLYLATGLVDGSTDALTWTQLEEASSTGLVTVGGHTHGHTDLSRASAEVAEGEMRRCKDQIEDRLGVACRHFAYPWAVASEDADRTARRLFETAALDAWRINRAGRVDPHRLGRTPVLRNDTGFLFGAKARGMLDGEAVAYRILRRGPWQRT
jgi:peptidoglycan/xylan/chitin deacetylase (PgdA/CDA1 family)